MEFCRLISFFEKARTFRAQVDNYSSFYEHFLELSSSSKRAEGGKCEFERVALETISDALQVI